jgi:hypothetical protein
LGRGKGHPGKFRTTPKTSTAAQSTLVTAPSKRCESNGRLFRSIKTHQIQRLPKSGKPAFMLAIFSQSPVRKLYVALVKPQPGHAYPLTSRNRQGCAWDRYGSAFTIQNDQARGTAAKNIPKKGRLLFLPLRFSPSLRCQGGAHLTFIRPVHVRSFDNRSHFVKCVVDVFLPPKDLIPRTV